MEAFDLEAYQELVSRNDPITEKELFLVLGEVQDTFGSVPRVVVEDLAARSGVPEARIWGALTAYGMDLHESSCELCGAASGCALRGRCWTARRWAGAGKGAWPGPGRSALIAAWDARRICW